jgi:hypothetical protein
VGSACITIQNTSGVTLDCQGHTLSSILTPGGGGIPSLAVDTVSNYTIKNCTILQSATVDNSSNGTLTGNTFGATDSTGTLTNTIFTHDSGMNFNFNIVYGGLQEFYSTNMVFYHNNFSTPTTTGTASLALGLFDGSSNTASYNDIDGKWPVTTSGGADDGIVAGDESNDTIDHNTIKNVWDAGIEFIGVMTASTISNNQITNAWIAGIAAYYNDGFIDCNFAYNSVTQSLGGFYFQRRGGLRPAGYATGFPAETGIYFTGNNFSGNTYTPIGDVGEPSVFAFLSGYTNVDPDGTTCNGGQVCLLGYNTYGIGITLDGGTNPTPDQFHVEGNTFSGNTFTNGPVCFGSASVPLAPGAVIDRGQDLCVTQASGACNPDPTAANYPLSCTNPGLVNAVDIVSSLSSGASSACNAADTAQGTGLAYSGTAAFGDSSQDWRYVLALVYGGKDITSGVVDCGQDARTTLVSNWGNLFQRGCSNGASACSDANHVDTNGNPLPNALWHAFRLDDSSDASAIFASLIGLTPAPSASANNGFGASPFCNAINWDTSAANANCALGANNQFTGPGGIDDPASTTTPKHRRPPPRTWGDAPDPTQGALGADVLPTSMQDNDPIRRRCIGGATNASQRPGEEVCNIDGALGLVLPVPESAFLTQQNSPAGPLEQYPTNACNTFAFGKAPTVFTCAIRGSGTKHAGECPNGDALNAGGCMVPIDSADDTSQCVATKATVATLQVRNLGNPDGRIYNLHMRDGTTTEPSIGYAKQAIQTPGGTVLLDFVGGFGRIHQVETVTGTGTACTYKDSTGQIGCLVQADPCSLGMAGDAARSEARFLSVDAVRIGQMYPSSVGYPLACPAGHVCQN